MACWGEGRVRSFTEQKEQTTEGKGAIRLYGEVSFKGFTIQCSSKKEGDLQRGMILFPGKKKKNLLGGKRGRECKIKGTGESLAMYPGSRKGGNRMRRTSGVRTEGWVPLGGGIMGKGLCSLKDNTEKTPLYRGEGSPPPDKKEPDRRKQQAEKEIYTVPEGVPSLPF